MNNEARSELDEASMARLDLALEEHSNSADVYQLRRAIWETSVGSIISMVVITLACIVSGVKGWVALGLIIATQVLRSAWLCRRMLQARRMASIMDAQTSELITELEERFPSS